jgi:hypothetical protein
MVEVHNYPTDHYSNDEYSGKFDESETVKIAETVKRRHLTPLEKVRRSKE